MSEGYLFLAFLKLITNLTQLVFCLTCYVDIITSTKGYKNNTLEPMTENLINKYINYKSNVLSTFSWLEPVLTPALDIGIAKSGSNLVHSPPSHILCRTPHVKARKSFYGVLPCLVMMHHQTNLDWKSFSISEDLVHRKMIFLNDTLADDDTSPY